MSALDPNAFVVIAVITRPHGVHGEVRVHPFNEDSTLLRELKSIWLLGVEPRKVGLIGVRESGDTPVLRIEGCDTREAAESYRGRELAVRRSELPSLDSDEHYHIDLVGAEVFHRGGRLGQVREVLRYPTVDALAVTLTSGEVEIPILEPYIETIDVPGRRIDVAYVEDFLDAAVSPEADENDCPGLDDHSDPGDDAALLDDDASEADSVREVCDADPAAIGSSRRSP